MEKPEPLCPGCAHWQPYPCKIGRVQTEAWRCTRAVKGAPKVVECRFYLREVGVEAW